MFQTKHGPFEDSRSWSSQGYSYLDVTEVALEMTLASNLPMASE